MTLRQLLSPAARILFLRRKLLFASGLEDVHPVEPGIRVKFRLGGKCDLAAFNQEDHGYDEAARSFGFERLAAGDLLVIGEAPSGIAFYAWVMFGQMDLGYRNYRSIPRDRVYTYKLFTVPGYRGQRICPAYYGWLKERLRTGSADFPAGIRRITAWVEAGNHASIRSHIRAGFHQTGVVWHIQLLFRSYFWIRGNATGLQSSIHSAFFKCDF